MAEQQTGSQGLSEHGAWREEMWQHSRQGVRDLVSMGHGRRRCGSTADRESGTQ